MAQSCASADAAGPSPTAGPQGADSGVLTAPWAEASWAEADPGEAEPSPSEWLIEPPIGKPADTAFGDALLHLSNGRQGIRSMAGPGNRHAEPGFHVAGVYDTGIDVAREIVNLPHPLGLAVRYEHEMLRMGTPVRQVLDMRQGLARTEQLLTSQDQREWRLRTTTLLHATQTAVGVFVGRLTPPAGSTGHLAIEVCWDNSTGNAYLGGLVPSLRTFHADVHQVTRDGQAIRLECRLSGTGRRLQLHSDFRCTAEVRRLTVDERSRWGQTVVTDAAGGGVTFAVVWTVRESPDEPVQPPVAGVDRLGELLRSHLAEWHRRWQEFDIRVDGDEPAQQALRFGVFNLLQHALPAGRSTLSPARGLSGSYHSGATFFDTELHKDAYYAWSAPDVARSHLMYRYRALPAAKAFAVATGFSGARYPVAADDLGQDTGPHDVLRYPEGTRWPEWNVREVVHISADVAYAVVRYHEVTGDEEFWSEYGLELLIETARFAASVFTWCTAEKKYVTRSVMGPDEYHWHVDNSLFTNTILAMNIRAALTALRRVPERAAAAVRARLALDGNELDEWQRLLGRVRLPDPLPGGVPAQHDGYGALPDCAPRADRGSPAPRWTEAERRMCAGPDPVPTRLVKQADVVLLAHLLPDALGEAAAALALEYYEPRTVHASSLSFAPHGVVAGRLGRAEQARRFLLRSGRYNLDYQPRSDYRNGLHLSAYAGAWQVLTEGMLRMEARQDELRLRPHLPRRWHGVEVPVRFRGRAVRIRVDHHATRVTVLRGAPLAVRVHGLLGIAEPGRAAEFGCADGAAEPGTRPSGRKGRHDDQGNTMTLPGAP